MMNAATLDDLARSALDRASPQAWKDPRVLAVDLGFRLLSVSDRHQGAAAMTTAERLVYQLPGLPEQRHAAVRKALARGLLLRAGRKHTEADALALAGRLKIERNPAAH